MVHKLLETIALGLRQGKLLSSDQLQLVILHLLSEKPRHGYEIIKAISEHSSGIYSPSPGMIYPALTFLEEIGYAVSKAEGSKKEFRITAEGKAQLEGKRAEVVTILDGLGRYGKRMADFQREHTDEQSWGGDQQKKEWRKLKHEFHEVKAELKEALFEKMDAPLEEKKRVLKVLKAAIAEIRKGQ
jgi:DNA-binding PadR family transcriptional regulator